MKKQVLNLFFFLGFSLQAAKLKQVFPSGDIIWGFDFLSDKLLIYTLKKGDIYLFDLE